MQNQNPSGDLKLYMIGNAHLDLAWLWRWEEAREEMLKTSRTVLQLMDQYPDFVYTCSQAAAYQWIEEADPELFEAIRTKVKEGRWRIAGGWWVQPDVNIPCGESYIRQALYGKRYFLEKFGVEVKTGYNVDSFGHHGQLPQLLTHCEMDHYVFFRPKPSEKVLPATVFWWQASDGSRVLACRPPFHYNTSAEAIDAHIELAAKKIELHVGSEMLFYGVGNHGGGPTRKNINSIRQMQKRKDLPQIIFSDPESFFADIKPRAHALKVVEDELEFHSRGCYSTHSDIKRWNRFLEFQLLFAEKVSALAELKSGKKVPVEKIRQAWQTVLFHQFHDILAGTSIPEVYADADQALTETLVDVAGIINASVLALTGATSRFITNQWIVFNPVAWERTEIISLTVYFRGEVSSVRLEDASGVEIPVQIYSRIFHPDNGSFIEISFAGVLPALGSKGYRAVPDERNEPDFEEKTIVSFETDFYHLTFDPQNGLIQKIYDKENDVQVLAEPGNRLVVLNDPWDAWGHDVREFRDEIGSFRLNGDVTLEEDGAAFAKIRVDSRYGNSTARQTIYLYKHLRRIDFELFVDWQEQSKMLKVAFPINLTEFEGTFESPYGSVKRPVIGTEEPLQRWMDISGIYEGENNVEKAYGVSLLNDSKYGGDIKNSEMRLTILRSPVFAKEYHRLPQDLTGLAFMDQGEQKVRYSLIPHANGWEEAHIVRAAYAFNSRPETYWLQGELDAAEASYVKIDPENVVLTVFKKAENGQDWILRFYETEGRESLVSISLPVFSIRIEIPVHPHQVKSILVKEDGNQFTAVESSGMENPLEAGEEVCVTQICQE
ncbi:mannosylglycerate hydrolase [bacterium BMS3Bbin03]|nr:mannosylglycerate hydrolase [bacterium BMS3Bbin03]